VFDQFFDQLFKSGRSQPTFKCQLLLKRKGDNMDVK
jgi:hypothetical protein